MDLITAARAVIDSWEGGDLAAAVRGLDAALKQAEKPHFVLIQEGGATGEHYVKGFGSRQAAQRHAKLCAKGAYRTSPVIEVAGSLAGHPDFYEVAEKIACLTDQYEYR